MSIEPGPDLRELLISTSRAAWCTLPLPPMAEDRDRYLRLHTLVVHVFPAVSEAETLRKIEQLNQTTDNQARIQLLEGACGLAEVYEVLRTSRRDAPVLAAAVRRGEAVFDGWSDERRALLTRELGRRAAGEDVWELILIAADHHRVPARRAARPLMRGGLAMDSYSDHLWTRDEIDHQVLSAWNPVPYLKPPAKLDGAAPIGPADVDQLYGIADLLGGSPSSHDPERFTALGGFLTGLDEMIRQRTSRVEEQDREDQAMLGEQAKEQQEELARLHGRERQDLAHAFKRENSRLERGRIIRNEREQRKWDATLRDHLDRASPEQRAEFAQLTHELETSVFLRQIKQLLGTETRLVDDVVWRRELWHFCDSWGAGIDYSAAEQRTGVIITPPPESAPAPAPAPARDDVPAVGLGISMPGQRDDH
ncbi:hypothetical protein [Actinomadura terrae]|uniref:hypothetical protein n=1 Tax=Actinomadura terrae TaxID=604353 RepID=UPI001FA6C432|nr:hypothetical protein [Actinomadura terrae]